MRRCPGRGLQGLQTIRQAQGRTGQLTCDIDLFPNVSVFTLALELLHFIRKRCPD